MFCALTREFQKNRNFITIAAVLQRENMKDEKQRKKEKDMPGKTKTKSRKNKPLIRALLSE